VVAVVAFILAVLELLVRETLVAVVVVRLILAAVVVVELVL
jgi:hypothetical protein